MTVRSTINVADLPTSEVDHRALIWWGNLVLLMIETTMFALLVATYFYIRQNFHEWPPPRVDRIPVLLNPLPEVLLPSINLGLLLVSCIPMFLCDRACLRKTTAMVPFGLVLCLLFGAVCIVLRFYEFWSFHFKWNDNAYATVVWTTLGMHLLHLITQFLETGILTVWIFVHGIDLKHARDVRVGATYWYWVAAIWVPLYILLFWGPRFL
jgi:cytochrome c oxidase subunit 3